MSWHPSHRYGSRPTYSSSLCPTEADRHHSEEEYAAALARDFEDAPDEDRPE